MQKFIIKIHKKTWEYEICDYSYSREAEKYIKVTLFQKGRFAWEKSVDLSAF